MKIPFNVIALTLLTATAALAAAPVYEPFDYPANTSLAGQIHPSGQAWLPAGPAGPNIAVRNNSLIMPGLPAPVGGHAALRAVAGPSALLPWGAEVTSGSFYFSLRFMAANLAGLDANGGHVLGFSPAASALPNSPAALGARLFVRLAPGGYNLGLTMSSPTLADVAWDPRVLDVNSPVFLVGSYTFASETGQVDHARLWIFQNGPLPEAEPSADLTSEAGPDLPRIASFALLQQPSPAQPALVQVDELRQGPAWDQVIPKPDPASDLAVALVAKLIEGRVLLTWNNSKAVLEEAENIKGPWTSVPDAVSPRILRPEDRKMFFRLRLNNNARLLQIEPSIISAGGQEGEELYVKGLNLSPAYKLRIGGQFLNNLIFVDENTIRADMPALAEGHYDVQLVDDAGHVVAYLQSGLEVVPGLAMRLDSPPLDTPAGESCASCGTTPKGPDHLNLFSGEFHFQTVDLRLRGRGPDLVWKRTYRSRGELNSAQGHGWDFSYNIFLTSQGSDLVLHDGQGRADHFELQTNGTFTRNDLGRVIQSNPGGSLSVLQADGARWDFHSLDSGPLAGKIAGMTDHNGNRLAFAYDPAGRLVTITDTLDRDLLIQYNSQGRIAALVDFSGRTFHYDYYNNGDAEGASGDLKSFTSPAVTGTPNGDDFPNGKTTRYTYSTGFPDARLNHNLLTITDPKGQTWLRNTFAPTENPGYLDFDRIIVCVQGNATDAIGLDYVRQTPVPANLFASTTVIVNDRVGNVSEYDYDSLNRLVALRQFTGRANPLERTTATDNRPVNKLRSQDPDYFATYYFWNAHSKLARVLYPNGNSMERVYEADLDPQAGPLEQGNLRMIRRLPGPLGADQTQLVETFYYAEGQGGCCGANFLTRHIDPNGNVTRHDYDDRGNRIRTLRPIPGSVEEWEYNQFGQITAHIHPDNGSGHRQRDESIYHAQDPQRGFLAQSILDALGQRVTTQFEYNPRGNLIRSTDPRGHVSTAVFNDLDQLVRETTREVVDGSGLHYQRDYFRDANDNLVRKNHRNYDEAGVLRANAEISIRYDYEILNEQIRELREIDDQHDLMVEHVFDANRKRIATRAGGEVISGDFAQLDERGLPMRIVKGPGSPEQTSVQLDYDANGQVIRQTQNADQGGGATTYQYDGFGRLVALVDAMGNVASYAYDANGNLIWHRRDGELLDVPGGQNNVRLWEESSTYDGQNRLVRSDVAHFDPRTQQPIGDGIAHTFFQYTPRSEITRVTDDNGHVITRIHDGLNRLNTVIDGRGNFTFRAYDASGNLITRTELAKSDAGLPDQTFVYRYEYDNLNRLVAFTDSLGLRTVQAYDSRDNLLLVTDPKGNVTRFDYDGAHRRTGTTRYITADGTGNSAVTGTVVTSRAYDHRSRLIAQTDPNGNTTQYAYDNLNRRIITRLADGTLIQVGQGALWPSGALQPDLSGFTSGYDADGNPALTTDANGTVVTAQNDALGRLTHKTIQPGPGVTHDTTFEEFHYDGTSRLVQAQDDDSLVLRFHDSLGRLIRESLNGQNTTARFDAVGNLRQCAYPGGRTLDFEYDALDRLQTVSEQNQVLARYGYFGAKRVESIWFPGTLPDAGRLARMDYDGGQRLERLVHLRDPQGNPNTLADMALGWDDAGNLISRVHNAGPFPGQAFAYDSINRLVESTTVNASGQASETGYTFDGAGNRVSLVENQNLGGYFLDSTSPDPADAQVNQYTQTPFEDQLHDANGNVVRQTSSGSDRGLAFDYANRLVGVTEPGIPMQTHYAYDAFGRRIGKRIQSTQGSFEVRYFYFGGGVIEEQDGLGATMATYVHGARMNETLSMRRAGRDFFYHADDMNNVLFLTDAAGNVAEVYTYGDYGAPTIRDASGQLVGLSVVGNDRMFQGRPYDVETGLYQFRHRYLDPMNGRFISRDPLGVWGDPHVNFGNAYTYAGNNPYRFADPTGLSSTTRESLVSSKDTWLTIKFTDCSTSEMNKIEDNPDYLSTTFASLEDAHDDVHAEINGGTPAESSTLSEMKRWFSGSGSSGTLSSDEKDDIHDVLWGVEDHMRDNEIKIECEDASKNTCDGGVNAYVVWGSNHLHICPSFWSSSKSDNERAAILFHEMTHAYEGTDDNGYVSNIGTLGTPTYTKNGNSVSLDTNDLTDNADTYEEFLQATWLP